MQPPIHADEAAEAFEEECPTDDDTLPEEKVLDLSCHACGRLLCRRGMRVRLVCDARVSLFSTDFRPMQVTEAAVERLHESCGCRVRDVLCACERSVGYHVILPCRACSSASHNDHYWLFDQGNVQAKDRETEGKPLVWTDLPLFAKSDDEFHGADLQDEADADTSEKDQLQCPICHGLLYDPVAPPCGHTACRRCLTRALDLRRECPYCRTATTCAELAVSELEDQVSERRHS